MAVSVIGISHIPPESCALSIHLLEFWMRSEVSVVILAERIENALDILTHRHVTSTIVGQLICQSRIVGATELSPSLITIREDSHPLLGDDCFKLLLLALTLEHLTRKGLLTIDVSLCLVIGNAESIDALIPDL